MLARHKKRGTIETMPSKEARGPDAPPPEGGWTRLKKWMWTPVWEAVRLLYLALVVLILPRLCVIRCQGEIPKGGALLAVTHVGGLDPDIVLYVTRNWQMRAVYGQRTPRVANFLLQSIWRFGVTQDPQKKAAVNPKTALEVVRYLRKGGQVMIFPEGHRPWEGRLYPGAAVLAHRAGVPLIPVGLEGPDLRMPEIHELPPPRGLWRVAQEVRKHGTITVHFGPPIWPQPDIAEEEDVQRMMQGLEQAFDNFYRTFLGQPGPRWR